MYYYLKQATEDLEQQPDESLDFCDMSDSVELLNWSVGIGWYCWWLEFINCSNLLIKLVGLVSSVNVTLLFFACCAFVGGRSLRSSEAFTGCMSMIWPCWEDWLVTNDAFTGPPGLLTSGITSAMHTNSVKHQISIFLLTLIFHLQALFVFLSC